MGTAPGNGCNLDPLANILSIGTVSNVLDPGLPLAYLRVPPHLAPEVQSPSARDDVGSTVAARLQLGISTLV